MYDGSLVLRFWRLLCVVGSTQQSRMRPLPQVRAPRDGRCLNLAASGSTSSGQKGGRMTLQASALSSRTWTRHQPPTRQPVTLARPALLQTLDELVDENDVTVVTAPSGFGKTT